MKRILVVADPLGGSQKVIERAVGLARSTGADLEIVGFVYEHIANLPINEHSAVAAEKIKERLLETHRKQIMTKFRDVKGKGATLPCTITVQWEKRVAEAVIERVASDPVDLVMKGAHRTESFTYTPTDWQLLRGCRSSVMLVAGQRWKKTQSVLAAVDLGTQAAGKKALNQKVVQQASQMAQALDMKLIIGYAVPVSRVLRDLDIIDERAIMKEGARRLDAFCETLRKRGIDIDGVQIAKGEPEKALVSAAAKSHAGLIVLGCVGRKRLAGKIIGNTAEQILRLARADVLAVKF